MAGYKPLEDYGVIGNLDTCALVSRDGSIDWCCLPHVQSPSLFGSILDSEKGGYFAIHPTESFEAEQEYVERSNVLRTTFMRRLDRCSTEVRPVRILMFDAGHRGAWTTSSLDN